jgi:cytochrome c oxidase assembly factor CtaG
VPVWLELLVLAFASMFWPTLILIVVLALRISHPVKILVWFLAGGLLTTITVGIAVVFALQGASFMSGSKPPVDPAIDITIGVLSLIGAFVLLRTGNRAGKSSQQSAAAKAEAATAKDSKPKKPPLTQRAVESGAPVAFVSGILLNIVPGTFPIVALKDIAQLDASNAAKVATIVVFYVIMFAFIEVPIVAYLIAPERTTVAVNEFNAWLGRNGRRAAAYVLAGVGLYLTIRGIIQLF